MIKRLIKKYGFTFVIVLLFIIILSIVITYNTNNLISELQYEIAFKYDSKTNNVSHYLMLGYNDDNLSNKPVDAYIENDMLIIKAELTNNTGNDLTLKDYGKISFGGYEYAGKYEYDKEILNNKDSTYVTFKTNISNLRNINILPTTVYVDFGCYDMNNNYKEYNLKYVISWYN